VPRQTFLLRRRRDFADWMVLLFLWATLAFALAWLARAGYREVRPAEHRNGLNFEPIWQ